MASIIVSPSPQPESHHERPLPGGLWRVLERQAEQPQASAATGIWSSLEHSVATLAIKPVSVTVPGIYTGLTQQADPAQYRPQALPGLAEEQVTEDDQTLTILRSAAGSYLRLTAPESELWHAMDGSHTVAQLGTMGFLRFKQLLPVADLVQTLRSQGFLTDPPVAVYRQLAATLEARTAEGWGRRVLRVLRQQTFAINTIDRPYTALYRAFGWVLFTRPAQGLYVVLGVAGLLAFVPVLLQHLKGQSQASGGSLPLALLAFYGALFVSFVLHESAHALAVKHYGRRVQRGGVMLYFGLPAAFVDTSDIWVAGRKARIVVSAAGPISDLMVGGIAALLAFFFPNWMFAGIAYRLTTACYVATLFNLNPLLELDGYFMLVDALRLPNLRRRALAFVVGPMWSKLRQGASFTREERIFRIYGLSTLIYTALAIVLAGLFWQRWFNILSRTLLNGGWSGWLVALLLIIAVIIPVAAGALLAAWGGVRSAAAWLQRRGYGRQPVVSAAALVLLVVLLAIQAGRPGIAHTWLPNGLQIVCWAVGLAALLAVLPDYQGADLVRALYAFGGAGGVALIASTASFLHIDSLRPIWGVALLLLMLASFAALLDVDLRNAPVHELMITAVLLAGAFVVGAIAFYQAQQPTLRIVDFNRSLLIAAPAYFGTLALALLLPHLFGLRDSRLLWSWALLWVGMFAQTAAYVLEIVPIIPFTSTGSLARTLDVLAAGLWASAWAVQLVTLRQLAVTDISWPNQPAISEAQRLQRAFRLCYAGCYQLLHATYGSRRAQALDDRMDILAATANWDVTLDNEQARIGLALSAAPLDRQGERYAEVLRYTVAVIEEIAGASFARRAIRSAYDALPWPEREAANRRCFPDTPWAADLSRAFGNVRDGRIRLLRQVTILAACDDDELDLLAAACQPVHVRAGHQVLGAGAVPAGVWVVEAGEIAAWSGKQMVEELHRSAHFGVTTLVAQPTEHNYRATVDSELLFLPVQVFETMAAHNDSHLAEGLRASEALRLLERVPLFTALPRNTLRGLAMVAQPKELDARAVIVREGVRGGTFYLIRSGRAVVITRSQAKDGGASEPGPLKVVAQIGPEEFFGELELLRGTPPVASVVALTPLSVLTLPHDALRALLVGSNAIARDLEQIGTGRLLDLRSRIGGG